MSRTLITGATGFIGCRMAELLHRDGRDVAGVGLVRNDVEAERADALRRAGVPLIEADLSSPGELGQACQGVETVIHLAAAQHEANVDAAYFLRINVEGTRELLHTSERHGVKRVFYASSIGVYGRGDGVLDEDTPVAPDNAYGRSKVEAERAIREYVAGGSRLEVFIGRIGETYGPWDRRLYKLFAGIARNRFRLVGSGTNLHQPVYVDDLVAMIDRMLATKGAAGRPLVLAGDQAITTREMCEAIGRAVGRNLGRLHVPLWPLVVAAVAMEATLGRAGIQPPLHRRRLDFFVKSLAFSTERRRRLLALPPQRSFEEGVRLTAAWYREQGWLPADPTPIPLPAGSTPHGSWQREGREHMEDADTW
jgi:nucleoside-diphosphate-sugar epimerase